MSADRQWAALRALPAVAILAALGVQYRAGRPKCPRCENRLDVCDDPAYGVSVRCINEGCRLGAWTWPEWALTDLRRIGTGEARDRLLAPGRDLEESIRQPGSDGARARLAAFMGAA